MCRNSEPIRSQQPRPTCACVQASIQWYNCIPCIYVYSKCMQMYPNVMFEIKQWSNLCSKSLLYQVYTNYIYIYIWGKKKINPDGTHPTVLATNSDHLSESGSSTRPSQHALLLVHVHMGVVSQLVGVCGTIVSYTHESNLNCTHPEYTHLKWLMSTHLAYWEYSHYGRHPVLKLLPASLLLVWVPHPFFDVVDCAPSNSDITYFIRLLVWYQSYYNQTNHCLFFSHISD